MINLLRFTGSGLALKITGTVTSVFFAISLVASCGCKKRGEGCDEQCGCKADDCMNGLTYDDPEDFVAVTRAAQDKMKREALMNKKKREEDLVKRVREAKVNAAANIKMQAKAARHRAVGRHAAAAAAAALDTDSEDSDYVSEDEESDEELAEIAMEMARLKVAKKKAAAAKRK